MGVLKRTTRICGTVGVQEQSTRTRGTENSTLGDASVLIFL